MKNKFYTEAQLNNYIQINAKEVISYGGTLVNISEVAADLGFVYPVFVADCAWNECLRYLKSDKEMNLSSLLNYMLVLLKINISNKAEPVDDNLIKFSLYMNLEDRWEPWILNLNAFIGKSEGGKPVILIKQVVEG